MNSRIEVFKRFTMDLATLSKCEERKVAAIITDGHLMQVYSIGINGGAKKLQDCMCNIGGRYGCVHAEAQAIAKCTEKDQDKIMFVTLSPCITCATLIVNTGFKRVYFFEDWKDDSGIQLLTAANIPVLKI